MSDWLGRRRVILAAILVEALAAVVFLFWPDVPGLVLARFVTGVGVGALTATATAHLSELRSIARPEEGPAASRIVSTVVNMGGLALGPLVGGILAVTVTAPLEVPYQVFLVLLLISGIAVAFVPETVERHQERRAYRPQRVSIPAASRGAFWSAAAGAFAGFAVFGLFTSLAPSFIAGSLHEPSRLLAGAVSFGVFAAGAIAQVVFAALDTKRALTLSVSGMVVGLALFALGVVVVSLPLFVVGGVLAGAGVGLLFRVSLGVAASLGTATSRGEVLAAMFLAAYTGLALPVLVVGAALAVLPVVPVLVGFVIVVAAMIVVAGSAMRARA